MTNYRIWYKRSAASDGWKPMTYPATDLATCEDRVEHYEDIWGFFYNYKIEPELTAA